VPFFSEHRKNNKRNEDKTEILFGSTFQRWKDVYSLIFFLTLTRSVAPARRSSAGTSIQMKKHIGFK